MPSLPVCHARIPKLLDEQISALGAAWFNNVDRPRITSDTASRWGQLLTDWLDDHSLALLVRKHNRNRGTILASASGRLLVPTDNSPAQWVFTLAYEDTCPSKHELAEFLASDKIPVAMAMSKEEKASAARKCSLGKFSVNRKGWKLAHARGIGFNSSRSLGETDDQDLRQHVLAFLSPTNLFVVPSAWAGLAEVESFSKHFRHDAKQA